MENPVVSFVDDRMTCSVGSVVDIERGWGGRASIGDSDVVLRRYRR